MEALIIRGVAGLGGSRGIAWRVQGVAWGGGGGGGVQGVAWGVQGVAWRVQGVAWGVQGVAWRVQLRGSLGGSRGVQGALKNPCTISKCKPMTKEFDESRLLHNRNQTIWDGW